ncbi:unnamed protein product [Brachionus calyciflorus]|uniref:Uncharacterized protein n=1 Tax=Brachionus calyciflorus TaxID=104777 RepID=A0A814CIU3_9BILA|nr:unnamed protein product [Brachionus calyciflorus]
MAPTSSSTAPKKSTQIEKKITTRVASKPILSKPAVLKENASNIQKEVLSQQAHGSIIERMSQRIETIGNDFEMVLSQIVNKLKLLEDGQNEIKVSFEKNQQNFEEIMEKIGSFDSRFEQLATGPTHNPIFTREQIAQARDTLGLDLNQELVHNGRYLITAAPFNKNNINLYGTKLLSILFTKEELANGTVEPIRTRV